MKKVSVLLLCLLASIMGVKAQIGYQIALLNTATGEARANETVTVSVSLSNSANEVFYSETKSATTNDFGVLSLTIGNADTFANVDLTKMPFFITVKANGVLIGKSQMLSVPVAEVAKQLAPIDKNLIVGTWTAPGEYYSLYGSNGEYYSGYGSNTITFNVDGTATYSFSTFSLNNINRCSYFIQGNIIALVEPWRDNKYPPEANFFVLYDGKLYGDRGVYSRTNTDQ